MPRVGPRIAALTVSRQEGTEVFRTIHSCQAGPKVWRPRALLGGVDVLLGHSSARRAHLCPRRLPPNPASNPPLPPTAGKIYAFNEGNYQLWSEEQRAYIDSLKNPDLWGGKPYSARYIGSLVGDFHRTLLYGEPGSRGGGPTALALLSCCCGAACRVLSPAASCLAHGAARGPPLAPAQLGREPALGTAFCSTFAAWQPRSCRAL